jgi:anti-sigma B factor antagonist
VSDFGCDGFLVEDHVGLVVIRGELDLNTATRMKERIVDLVEKGAQSLVLDLSEVTFVDSTALGAIVGAQRRCEGTVALVVTSRRVLRTFEITGLDKALLLLPTREDALQLAKEAPVRG